MYLETLMNPKKNNLLTSKRNYQNICV